MKVPLRWLWLQLTSGKLGLVPLEMIKWSTAVPKKRFLFLLHKCRSMLAVWIILFQIFRGYYKKLLRLSEKDGLIQNNHRSTVSQKLKKLWRWLLITNAIVQFTKRRIVMMMKKILKKRWFRRLDKVLNSKIRKPIHPGISLKLSSGGLYTVKVVFKKAEGKLNVSLLALNAIFLKKSQKQKHKNMKKRDIRRNKQPSLRDVWMSWFTIIGTLSVKKLAKY